MFIKINFIELKQKRITFQGTFNYEKQENYLNPVMMKCNDCNILPEQCYQVLSDMPLIKLRFQYTVLLENSNQRYMLYFLQYNNNVESICRIESFHYFCPISMKFSNSYYCSDDRLLSYNENSFFITPNSFEKHIIYEWRFCKQLLQEKNVYDVITRQLYFVLKCFQRKKIWIFFDRIYRANDNAETFFEYVQAKKDPRIMTYFFIDKHSVDYKRLKKIGKVIPFFSFREKLLFLLCEYKISSHADHYTTYPMGDDNYSFQDLLQQQKFIFLQHGVIKDDLSKWLNYYNRKIYGFITSAEKEVNSILSLQYEYQNNQIWLTGLPRFDKLYHNEQKLITIMPTWRKYLFENEYTLQGTRKLKTDFKNTDFYKMYDSLLSNSTLKKLLFEKGYKLGFMPHPMMEPYIEQFPQYKHVYYFSSKVQYQDIYAWSDLIITDYSSAVFDFALLKKPILYFQFDFEKFFSGAHTFKQGYFDYEKMAFGEIVNDVEHIVQILELYLENNCKMPLAYQKRVDAFFKYNDKNNCKRLYTKLKSFEKNKYNR